MYSWTFFCEFVEVCKGFVYYCEGFVHHCGGFVYLWLFCVSL